MKFVVLVCGGRDLDEMEAFRWLLHNGEVAVAKMMRVPARKVEVSKIVEGTARGGDAAGRAWGEKIGATIDSYQPDWDRLGKAAGHIRNGEMLTQGKPDCVIALPGGRGTANMIEQSRRAGIPVFEVKYDRSR